MKKNTRKIKLIFIIFIVVSLLVFAVSAPILYEKNNSHDMVIETTTEKDSGITKITTTAITRTPNADSTFVKTEATKTTSTTTSKTPTTTTMITTTTTGTTTTTTQDPVDPCPFECSDFGQNCTAIVGQELVVPARNAFYGTINATEQFRLNVGVYFPNWASVNETNMVHEWVLKDTENILRDR